MRVAASVALHHGFSPYSTVNVGTITTWIYGPVPLYALWPAGWASSAAGALEIAGAINLVLVVLSIVIGGWVSTRNWTTGLVIGMGLALAWPVGALNTFAAEHVVIFLTFAGMLLLRRGCGSAACLMAVLAVFSKQTAVGVALAQLIYIWSRKDLLAATKHLGLLATFGMLFSLLFSARFGFRSLWDTMVAVPFHMRWTSQLHWQLIDDAPYLALAVAVTAGAICTCRRRSTLFLPALTYLALFPLALLNFFKIGGDYRAFDVALIWLIPALSSAVLRFNVRGRIGVAVAASLLGFFRLQSGNIALLPDVEHYREAVVLAHDGTAWFPQNPLITLYSEGRYFHDEDGLYEREQAGRSTSRQRLLDGLPENLHRVIYMWRATTWGIAQRETGSVGQRYGLLWFVVPAQPTRDH